MNVTLSDELTVTMAKTLCTKAGSPAHQPFQGPNKTKRPFAARPLHRP